MCDKKIIEWGIENGYIDEESLDTEPELTFDLLKGLYDLKHGKLKVLHQKEDGTPWIGYLHESYEEAMERQSNEDILDQPAELSSLEIYINEHPEDFRKK